jgi:hypothetical protein
MIMNMWALRIVTLVVLTPLALMAKVTPEELAKRQCRSVHLGYEMKESAALYNEVVVLESAPGSYFCALGFNRGYFGMQELASGEKLIIFSVWDNSKTDDKHSVEEAKRARAIEQGEGVRVGRFGGEGTGAQSFYDYEWELGERMRFLVQADAGKGYTEFSGWFYDNHRSKWQLMTRLRTPTEGIRLKGGYSFVEDFRRNYKSAKLRRRATYENGWAQGDDGEWSRLAKARFTADPTPSENVDAGPVGDGFFLSTGGDTEMKTTKLWEWMENPDAASRMPDTVEALMKAKP